MSNIKSTKAKKGKDLVIVDVMEDGDTVGSMMRDEDGLTPKQQAFVKAYIVGQTAGNGSQSAIAAGYSEKTAPQIQTALLKLPHIISAIDAELRDAITGRLTVKAVKVAEKILDDEGAPLRLRGDMAQSVIQWSGVVQRAQREKAVDTGLDGNAQLNQMSRSDLEETVRKGAAILTAAASLPPAGQVIEGSSAHNSAHAADIAAE